MTLRNQNAQSKSPNIEDILNSLSDHKSLVLFKAIALATKGNSIVATTNKKMNINHKQHSLRLSKLVKAHLIERNVGRRYVITSLGRDVYNALKIIESTVKNYSKLKVIDLFDNYKISKEELAKLIDNLIDDYQIKEVLLSQLKNQKWCYKNLQYNNGS